MRRICMFALLSALPTGALSVPAFADPLQLSYSPYVTSVPAQQPVYVMQAAAPRGYVTAQPQTYSSGYPQSYQQAAPSYTGSVAPRYASAAPAPSYAPP